MDPAIKEDIELRTPDGWYGLASPPGWDDLVSELHQHLVSIDPDYCVFQIKEKFGGLRYYFSTENRATTRDMYDAVRVAELLSYRICQDCGERRVGRVTTAAIGYWIVTLCDECRTRRIKKRDEQKKLLEV